MDLIQCEYAGCGRPAEFVCSVDKHRICSYHHPSHCDSPGQHSLNKLFRRVSSAEQLAVHRTICAVTQTAQNAIASELAQMRAATERLREEIRAIEQSCATQIQKILAECQAKVAKLKRVSGVKTVIRHDDSYRVDSPSVEQGRSPLLDTDSMMHSEPGSGNVQQSPEGNLVDQPPPGSYLEQLVDGSPEIKEVCGKVQFFREAGDKTELCNALLQLGEACWKASQYSDSLQAFQEAKTLAQCCALPELLMRSLFGLGKVYHSCRELPQAIESFKEAINLCRDTNRYVFLARCWHHLGTAYSQLERWIESIEAIEEAVRFFREAGHAEEMLQNVLLLAKFYVTNGDPFKALEQTQEGMTLASNLGMPHMRSTFLALMGSIYFSQHYINEGLEYLYESRRIFTDLENHEELAGVLILIGSGFTMIQQFDKAADTFTECISLCQRCGLQSQEQEAAMKLEAVRQKTGQQHNNDLG